MKSQDLHYIVTLTRRQVCGLIGSSGLASIGGCVSDEESDQQPAETQTAGDSDGSECETVTKTRTEVLADEVQTVDAGGTWAFTSDLEEGDQLTVHARQMGDDARPAVEIEDPHGNPVATVEPSSQIRRTIVVETTGRYVIRFPNEALLTAGMWNVKIEVESEYEEEVCQ